MDIHALELATVANGSVETGGRFYRVSGRYRYSGWTDMPRCLFDHQTFVCRSVSDLDATVLDMATAKVDYQLPFVPESIRSRAEALEGSGILERCDYGAPCRTFVSYPNRFIRSVQWAITGRCNYRCKHCFVSAPDAKFGEISTEDCLRIVRELAEAGVTHLDLTGGEPLVRQDLKQIISELTKYGIRVDGIGTNGSLVTECFLDELEELGQKPRFFMSYDGVGWHDWLRGIPGAEKTLMGKFELLARRGYYTGGAMTLHKRNLPVLRETVNRLADVGAQMVLVNRMLNFGEWQKYGSDFNISHAEIFEAYLDYLPHFYEDGMPLTVSLNRMLRLERHSYDVKLTAVSGKRNCLQDRVCPSAYSTLYINGDGKLAPCMAIAGVDQQAKNCTDLTKMSLREALKDSAYDRCVRQTLADYFAANPECDACKYKIYCHGGCRSQATEFYPDNYLGVDRHRCEYFFGHYTERILKCLAETVPQARVVNLPADFPLEEL